MINPSESKKHKLKNYFLLIWIFLNKDVFKQRNYYENIFFIIQDFITLLGAQLKLFMSKLRFHELLGSMKQRERT